MNAKEDIENNEDVLRRYYLKKWKGGIAYEVAFWNNLFRWNKGYQEFKGKDEFYPIELDDFDANAYLNNIENPKVLDVGAGMSYLTGNCYVTPEGYKMMDIDYVDPLAYYYNRIIKRYRRINAPVKFGMVEYLSTFYEGKKVDLIVIQNALDHSFNPVKGIIESLNTLTKGGILYLNHHVNEADKERHKGFHQYNIYYDGHLKISNSGECVDIDEMLKGVASIKSHLSKDGHVISILEKTGEVPTGWIKHDEDISQLTYFLSLPTNLSNALKEKFSYFFFNIIQFFVQSLSWEKRMQLKKILKI